MADPLRLVVYINGVRFDPRAVSCTFTPGQAVSFSVDVTPVVEWARLPERSHVVVFFSDPVALHWRLLCEGESVSVSWARMSTGQRARTIHCRGLHGYWSTATHATLASVYDPNSAGAEPDSLTRLLGAKANGQLLLASQDMRSDLQPFSLNGLLQKTQGRRVDAMFQRLVKSMTAQIPVEAFYLQARRGLDKMMTFEDQQIEKVVDLGTYLNVLQNGYNSFNVKADTSIASILNAYQAMAMYHQVPIPCPPYYTTDAGPVIPELMFLPMLYDTIPPACNVIFDDQIMAGQGTIDYLNAPTRVVMQLQSTVAPNGTPKFYVANDLFNVVDVLPKEGEKNAPPVLSTTHGLFSYEEMLRGVVSVTAHFPFEKITAGNPSQIPLDVLIDSITRHHWSVERGRASVRNLTCGFLPYLVPGFTGVIEDGDASFHAYVASVSHSITAGGGATTQVTMTHVREAFAVEHRNRTPPLAAWMNDLFHPDKILTTYSRILGNNDYVSESAPTERQSAAATAKAIEIQPTDGAATSVLPTQVDMDRFVGETVSVPIYRGDTGAQLPSRVTNLTRADMLRMTVDPQKSMARFQYRDGTSLRDYIEFHGLSVLGSHDDFDRVDLEPPALLFNPNANEGVRLFGNPFGMQLERSAADVGDDDQTASHLYGMFKLLPGPAGTRISNERQEVALMIQTAIKRMITNDAHKPVAPRPEGPLAPPRPGA